MRLKYVLLVMPLISILVGCALPETTVTTVDTRPSIEIKNAPAGSTLYLDGVGIGPAPDYDGDPTVLMVEPGTHLVEIRSPGGDVVFSRKIYVESELKTINVR